MTATSTPFEISVVIVGWNAKYYLELCLESLAKAPPRRSMEVLVVDNASTDGTMLYTAPLTTPTPLPSGSLIQVGKLTKIDNLHLTVLASPTPSPSPGSAA